MDKVILLIGGILIGFMLYVNVILVFQNNKKRKQTNTLQKFNMFNHELSLMEKGVGRDKTSYVQLKEAMSNINKLTEGRVNSFISNKYVPSEAVINLYKKDNLKVR